MPRQIHRAARPLLIGMLLFNLNACAPLAAEPPVATPTRVPMPTTGFLPTPTAGASTAELEAYVATHLLPALTDAYTSSGLTSPGLVVRQLQPFRPDQPLWAVFSTGAADPSRTPHFVALYAHTANGWQEQGRIALRNSFIVASDDVQEVLLGGERVWLLVEGASGLSGPCCVDVLSFNGMSVRSELAYTNRTIAAVAVSGEAMDRPELVISVQPWGGAAAPPLPVEQHRFVWDGSTLVERERSP